MDTVLIIDSLLNVIIKSIAAIQAISGKTESEVMEAIKDEGAKTDELLSKLR